MAEDIEKLISQAASDFRAGTESKARGDSAAARQSLLRAAEKLMLAAGMSSGRLRESRKKLAEELLAEANALKQSPLQQVHPVSSSHPVSVGNDEQAATWLVSERPNVTFADVAGLEEVKEQIRLKLLYPFTHRDYAQQYGIQPGGGILLFGPPGTGKTLIARAVAGEMEAAFFTIKPSEIMSQWVGVAEQNIARLFAEAKNFPTSVIFIDEMEALAPKRRSSNSTVMQRVVPQLLAELDGFEKRETALLFVGATNEPWAIDSAILRPGRLDRLIYVPPPDLPGRTRILELNLKNAPVDPEISLDKIAAQAQGFSGADMNALARRVRERVFFEAIHQGLARQIQIQDFEKVLEEMTPSISAPELLLFERFASGQDVRTPRRTG
jgi:transitional endoplasmic reticulum ATPase